MCTSTLAAVRKVRGGDRGATQHPHPFLVCVSCLLLPALYVFRGHKNIPRSSRRGAVETNPTMRNHEVVGSIPGLARWVEDLVLP